jgi:hypothetical protein
MRPFHGNPKAPPDAGPVYCLFAQGFVPRFSHVVGPSCFWVLSSGMLRPLRRAFVGHLILKPFQGFPDAVFWTALPRIFGYFDFDFTFRS